MSLTLGRGRPLSTVRPVAANFRIEGPDRLLFFDPFPRRIRAFLGGELVLDSTRAMLLHESGLMVVLYVPREDVLAEMQPTNHTTHCPYKGEASYWTVLAGGRTALNAAWGYRDPVPEASWLAGYVAFHWEELDAWFDEDEETRTHPRDPYSAIDVRASSRHVQVRLTEGPDQPGEAVADTRRSLLLSEGPLPNRYYVPREDVRADLLAVSPTHTHCPYKGQASYLHVGGVPDGAWHYPAPYPGLERIRDHLCFHGEGIEVLVDGEPIETGMPARPANLP